MTDTSESFLYVKANEPNKTFIGGTFCLDEEGLRDMFQQGADIALDIESGRQAVYGGMSPEDAVQKFKLNQSSTGRTGAVALIKTCLNRIAAGECAVYPRAQELRQGEAT